MTKKLNPTAVLRRFDGKTGALQQERLTVTPVDLLLESFNECWPFHKTHEGTVLDRKTYIVYVYTTNDDYMSDSPLYTFTIDPLEA